MKLLLVSEVAKILNASNSLVYELMRSGRLPYVAIGRSKQGGKRIHEDDLATFIEENRVVEQGSAPPLKVRLKHLQL